MLGLGLGLSKTPGPLGDPAPFITEWQTTTANETITIPIITNNTYTYTTSDDQSGTTNGGSTTITFPTAGTHEVFISGDIQQIKFNNTGDKDKIYDIKQWGTDTTYVDLRFAFWGCSNLDVTASDTPNINGSGMAQIFRNCVNLEGTSAFNSWDTTGVVNAGGMFDGATLFNQDISNWNTSSFFNLSTGFKNTSFNQDIGNWDTSTFNSLFGSFQNTPFNQDIGNWDVSNVTNFSQTLRSTPFDQDISGWDITSATNFTNFMLGVTISTCNYDALLIGWEATLQGTYANGSGYGATISANFGNSQYTAGGAAEAARDSLETTFGWTIADGGIGAFADNVFVTEWQTTTANETLTIPMVTSNTYDVVVISDTYNQVLLNQTGSTTTAAIPTSGTYQVGIIGNAQQIQFADTGDKLKIYDVKQWGTDVAWTSFEDAFNGCTNLDVTATDAPNLSSVTTMLRAFRNTDLTTFNNINNWNVSSVNNMAGMFLNSTSFDQDISNWNTGSVTTMQSMFANSPFNQDIGGWDVSSVTNLQTMFLDNTDFDQNLSGWDITSATDMLSFLFGGSLSTSNYDATLIGWAAQSVNSGLSISFGTSQFTAGGTAEAARNTLTTTYSWTISDGGSV
jgi:surface protein